MFILYKYLFFNKLYNIVQLFIITYKQGFETRGTEIGNRQVTWDNLIKALEKGSELVDDVTRIPTNILPQHYSDMDLRKNDIIVQFVSYFYYLTFVCCFTFLF